MFKQRKAGKPLIDAALFHNPKSQESAVDSIVNRFRDLLLQRKLRPGDLLPSESALAQGMGVSRGSVREAMKILTALGVVDVRRGDGTYVSATGQPALDPFLLRLMMSEHDAGQMLEFRQMIEHDVTRAIMGHGNPEGIAEMRQAVERMEQAVAAGQGMQNNRAATLDMEFHRAMGRAAGNRLIEQLYQYILCFFEQSIRQMYDEPGNAAKALAHHRQILSALERRDEEGALRAVDESVKAWGAWEVENDDH